MMAQKNSRSARTGDPVHLPPEHIKSWVLGRYAHSLAAGSPDRIAVDEVARKRSRGESLLGDDKAVCRRAAAWVTENAGAEGLSRATATVLQELASL